MAEFTKRKLSGSVDGCGISVSSVSGGGTSGTIHQGVAGTSDIDEVWLYAVNRGTSTVVNLTLEWGTSGTAGNIKAALVGGDGLMLVAPGLLIQNSLPITAFAETANVITVHGYVNRITE